MSVYNGTLPIVTDGLVLYLDVANPKSYSGTGNTLSDLIGNSNGNLINNPTFDINNKSIVFDGIDDSISNINSSIYSEWTINFFQQYNFNEENTNGTFFMITPSAGTNKEGQISWENSYFYDINTVLCGSDNGIYVGG